jgi:hypothetical protein
MISLANQLEMIRPSLNLKPSPPEIRPKAQTPAPMRTHIRIPARVTRDGVSWSPMCWYDPISNHDRQRAMNYLRASLAYGVSIDPTSRWALEIGDRVFRIRDAAEINDWTNG